MFTKTTKAARTADAAPWNRQRLVVALVSLTLVVMVLLGGLGYAVSSTIGSATDSSAVKGAGHANTGISDPSAARGASAHGQAHRNAIAAAPMLQTAPQDMQPAAPSAEQPDRIVIPAADRGGPAQVPTGFGHTPQGAVGQLAAIDTTALESMDVAAAGDIYQAWALPGGPGAQHWEITTDVVAFLGGAGQTSSKDQATTVKVDPAGALIKGVDGPDWTLACVQLRVRATITTDAEVGAGHCSRMQWVAGRWMIAPGKQPSPAPSTWPGTTISRQAGWLTWETAGSQSDQEPTS